MIISIWLKSETTDKVVELATQCMDLTCALKKVWGNTTLNFTTQDILMKVLMTVKMTHTVKLPACSSAMIHTALHRLTSYWIINKFIATFDDYFILCEESRSCTSEVFIPIDCTDTSTSQLTTSSMPITVLLQDTVCQLFSENTIVFEDSQQRIFDHTEVTGYPMHKRLLIQLCMYTHRILRILKISMNSVAVWRLMKSLSCLDQSKKQMTPI